MKVLFTGKGTSGSWQVRGLQIAEALRARGVDAVAMPKAAVEWMRAADVIVLVKRPTFELISAIRQSGKPFAWDIVDAWPQPGGNEWPEARALTWLRTMVEDVRPNLLICATLRMMEDARYQRSCVIYHHARPGLTFSAPCNCEHVDYEGGEHYLGRYRDGILSLCIATETWMRFPLDFSCKPLDVESDVAVCLRDCAGYAPKHWKSNVKLANAQALGIPALCSPECGYKETSTGGVLWIESPDDLPAAFDVLTDRARYAELCAGIDKPPTIEQIAEQYERELRALC